MLKREKLRSILSIYVELPGARFLRRIGLSPNAITFIGFGICVMAAVLVGSGQFLSGGIMFLIGAGLDLFDGALARLAKSESSFGALLDSVFDRLGEASLFLGIAAYILLEDFSKDKTFVFTMILIIALIFSQTVSYLRARGEGLNAFTRSGIMTRTERVIVLGVGLIMDHFLMLDLMLWILLGVAIVSSFTLLQRLLTIRSILRTDD